MNIIECRNLIKSYGEHNALSNLTFQIDENKITGLIGRNGAGKSTLLKTISGHLRHSSGEIYVFGEAPFNSLLVSANTFFVEQHMNLPDSLNLMEILEVAESFYPNWDMKLAKRLLDYFSLHPRQYHFNLSEGMLNTFQTILGISSHCALTILDEPTTGMDAAVRKDFYRALLKDYIAYPRSIILSSHHLEEIEDLLEDVLLIKEGEKLLHMPMTDLKEMAISLKGKTEMIDQWTQGREIIYDKRIGVNQSFVVIKNNISDQDAYKLQQSGIEISQVDSSDICMYLTSKSKRRD